MLKTYHRESNGNWPWLLYRFLPECIRYYVHLESILFSIQCVGEFAYAKSALGCNSTVHMKNV